MESSSPSSSRPAKRGKYANDENHGEHKDDGNDDSSNNGNGKSNRGENDDAGNRDDANDGNNNNSNANNDNSFHFHAQSEEERRACFIEMAWEHYRNYVDSIDRGEISDDDFSDDGENEEEAEDGHRDDGDGEARALPAEVSDVEDACNDERGKEGGREKERGGDERGADAEAEEEQVIIRRQIPMMDVAAAAAAAALEPPPPNNPPNHRDEEGPDVQTPGATAELHGLVFVLSHVSFSPFDDERFREAVAAREARGDDGKSQLIFPNVDSCMLPLLLSMAYVHLASHAISNTMFRDHDEVVREEGEEEEEEGEEEEEEEEEEQDAMEAQSSIETHFKFYPSLDLTLHPDGACLDDGNEPGEYALNADEFLFDSREECCAAWFLDADLCLAATGHGTGALLPTSSPTVEDVTPWPTWSDDVFDDDDDDDDEDDEDNEEGDAMENEEEHD